MVFRYQTPQDVMVQLGLELIHPQKLEQITLKRELQLTATEEWTTLKVPLDQAGHYLFSLRLESASPGLVIDDVQVGAQPK